MGTSQKFFRRIWRINAVLILLAAGIIILAVGSLLVEEFGRRIVRQQPEAETGIPVVAPESKAHPRLGHAEVVPGSDVMRANLTVDSEGSGLGKGSAFGSGSGGYVETRNILFIESGEKAAHWLLPDNDHVIEETRDVKDEAEKMTIGTVALVRPKRDSGNATAPEGESGRLLLFDSSGKNVVEVAGKVTELHLANLSSGGLTILYERNRRLVLAVFDPGSLAKRRMQEIDIPLLK